MQITVQYEPTAEELANASSLFVEKKPFLLIAVGIVNIMASLLLAIMILKLVLLSLDTNEWFAMLAASVWLFGRRPFNEWLLLQRMRRSSVVGKTITVDISANGIIWMGKGLKPGNMSWSQVKYLIQAKNGFLLPNHFTQFLWLPLRGFRSEKEIEDFKNWMVEKKILLRSFPKWQC